MRKDCAPEGENGLGWGDDCKCQHANCNYNNDEFQALVASITTLSQNINAMIVHMGAKQQEENDATSAVDWKMGANTKKHVLMKNLKRKKNDARLCLWSKSPPVVSYVLLSL